MPITVAMAQSMSWLWSMACCTTAKVMEFADVSAHLCSWGDGPRCGQFVQHRSLARYHREPGQERWRRVKSKKEEKIEEAWHTFVCHENESLHYLLLAYKHVYNITMKARIRGGEKMEKGREAGRMDKRGGWSCTKLALLLGETSCRALPILGVLYVLLSILAISTASTLV